MLSPDSNPLIELACRGDSDGIRATLGAGADVNATSMNRFSALHAAAMQGHTSACLVLLEAGANPDAQTDPQRYAPLHSAAFAGHRETVLLLFAMAPTPSSGTTAARGRSRPPFELDRYSPPWPSSGKVSPGAGRQPSITAADVR